MQTLSFPGGPALAVADFNNDGKLDIATGNSVLLGKGDGTFQPPLPLSATGLSAVAADFNNDGKPDLAIAGRSPYPTSTTVLFTILLGNGDGTFRALPPISMGSSISSFNLAQADVNKDGKPDLLAVLAGAVFVFLGRGDGTFASPTQYGTGSNPASNVLPADVNGDANVDLVIGCAGFISVLLGNGDGTFKAPVVSAGGDLLAAGDVNGDGKVDLIVQNKPSNLLQPPQDYVQFGNGDGTFQAMTNPLPFAGPVALGDLNGDGKVDLVIENAPFVSFFVGVGDGTFIHQHDNLLQLEPSGPVEIFIADFNNDGIPDIAMDSSLLLGAGNLDFAAPPALNFNEFVSTVVGGDFNKDGNPDMAAQIGTNLVVALGDGTGTLVPAHTYSVSERLVSPAAPDLNSDGNVDLVGVIASSSSTWSVAVELGAGDGSFGSPVLSAGDTGVVNVIVLGDFNGDGKLDLAITETPQDLIGPGSLLILLGNGDGTFAAPMQAGINPGYIVAGDFNGDGKLDLAAASPAGIGLLLGNGDGTFQPMTMVSPSPAEVLTSADVNLDGKADLIATTGLQTVILLGNGDGSFHTMPALALSGILLIADMNGDGNPDIVLSRSPQNGPGELDDYLAMVMGILKNPSS